MATSAPPRKAIISRVTPPLARSLGVSLSSALDFVETLSHNGIAFAPIMPEGDALQAASQAAGITPKQALTAYRAILDYE